MVWERFGNHWSCRAAIQTIEPQFHTHVWPCATTTQRPAKPRLETAAHFYSASRCLLFPEQVSLIASEDTTYLNHLMWLKYSLRHQKERRNVSGKRHPLPRLDQVNLKHFPVLKRLMSYEVMLTDYFHIRRWRGQGREEIKPFAKLPNYALYTLLQGLQTTSRGPNAVREAIYPAANTFCQ